MKLLKSLKQRLVFFSLASGMCLAAGAAYSEELIINGSFEQSAVITSPDYEYEYVPGNRNTIPGWQTILTGVERFNPNIFAFGNAQDGTFALDLNTDYGIGSGIYQNITTIPGKTYIVSFFGGTLSGAIRDGFGRITVSAGNVSQQFTVENPTSAVKWQPFTMTFTATSSYTAIAFLNFSNTLENFSFIDNVSVQPAP